MYVQSVYPPYPDDDAWIGVETSESKKDFSARGSDEPFWYYIA